ncbi:hypothetical protein B296_00051610 [Ensete ventricosum]|uniref:Beta-glucosidase n=1 Tax=Ensete ventricosum TaxID=4639 RepID=A0A426Y3L7_ENSVE|nr:hypothetical protein B296_00051610 [Ensete ventricosum]
MSAVPLPLYYFLPADWDAPADQQQQYWLSTSEVTVMRPHREVPRSVLHCHVPRARISSVLTHEELASFLINHRPCTPPASASLCLPMRHLCFPLVLLVLLVGARCSAATGEEKAAKGGKPWLDTGGLSRGAFPAGFTFGTAASAYQVEGMALQDGRGPSIWDAFVRIPAGEIANNATADVTVDEYHHYKGEGRVNWKGVAYYNRLINYMLQRGITPYANLYHYDLPEALEKKYNGLLSRRTVEAYANYAEFCFKAFGDRVKNWMTFNEPRVVAALGYDDGKFAPGRCTNCSAGNSATEPYIVAHNMILSHAAAVKRYRDKYQEIVQARLPKFTEEEIKMVKGSIDYVGINQYTAYYMFDPHLPKQEKPTRYQSDWNAGFACKLSIAMRNTYCTRKPVVLNLVSVVLAVERNGAHSEWLYIVPWGMYKAVTYVKEHYGNPIVILSENGMDDPGNVTLRQGLHDTTRINYYRSYITELKKAIDDGADVIGYFAWSLLDNFEWKSGYTSRFGIVYVDYKNLRRYAKMSAYWFKQMLDRGKRN